MTVKDLIKKLEEVKNKDMEVWLEGCDCTATWNGKLKEYDEDNELLLEREQ